MAMGSCYKYIRYSMIFCNVLFWVLGCAILAVGIWVRADDDLYIYKYVSNTDHFHVLYTAAYIFIGVGCSIMLAGFLGCYAAIRENKSGLGRFFAWLFVIFVILLGAGIYAVLAKDQAKDIVNDALIDGVNGYFRKSTKKQFMDMVMLDFKCCGATTGYTDFDMGMVELVEACKRFDQPCNEKFYQFVENHLLIIAGVAIGIAGIMVLGMIFSMILCCALRDSQVD